MRHIWEKVNEAKTKKKYFLLSFLSVCFQFIRKEIILLEPSWSQDQTKYHFFIEKENTIEISAIDNLIHLLPKKLPNLSYLSQTFHFL